MRKIFCAVLVTLALCVTLDRAALAAPFSSGSGSSENPFIITTVEELNAIRNHLVLPHHFRLDNDIDLTAYLEDQSQGWLPIGNMVAPFIGNFNGNGHMITGLWIYRSGQSNVGLFGVVNNATIRNLGVEIAHDGIIGNNYVGGIAGRLAGSSSITSSYATGDVSGNLNVGGLVGLQDGFNSSITNSYAVVNVKGRNNVGGLVGGRPLGGSITNSYSTGDVTGDLNVGGLMGSGGGSIVRSYAVGNITGDTNFGGLVGFLIGNGITYSFRYEGLTINGNIITDSALRHGLALSADELMTRATYEDNGWLFHAVGSDNPWHWDPSGFPKLNIGLERNPFPWFPRITTTELPSGTVGTAYSHTLEAAGTTPITWAIINDSLPSGLELEPSTGEISGTPDAPGTYSFTVGATNTFGTDYKTWEITIRPSGSTGGGGGGGGTIGGGGAGGSGSTGGGGSGSADDNGASGGCSTAPYMLAMLLMLPFVLRRKK